MNLIVREREKMTEQRIMLSFMCVIISFTSAVFGTSDDNGLPKKDYSKKVYFRIFEAAEWAPLKNHKLDIYYYTFYKPDKEKSPYRSKDANNYITSVTTDENCYFGLNLSQLEVRDIVVQPEGPYEAIILSRRTKQGRKSADHISVSFINRYQLPIISNKYCNLKHKEENSIFDEEKAEQKIFSGMRLEARKFKKTGNERIMQEYTFFTKWNTLPKDWDRQKLLHQLYTYLKEQA
ncbi:MAG: hypothetical protein H8D47_03025, partial [Planctomycetes bacterium]|nr:hypothetical protein [Planctomycetota bacterium]